MVHRANGQERQQGNACQYQIARAYPWQHPSTVRYLRRSGRRPRYRCSHNAGRSRRNDQGIGRRYLRTGLCRGRRGFRFFLSWDDDEG